MKNARAPNVRMCTHSRTHAHLRGRMKEFSHSPLIRLFGYPYLPTRPPSLSVLSFQPGRVKRKLADRKTVDPYYYYTLPSNSTATSKAFVAPKLIGLQKPPMYYSI